MTSSHSSLFFIFLLLTLLLTVSSDLNEDTTALLNFMKAVGHESKTNWRTEPDMCEWTGVTCDSLNLVFSLILPGASLVGEIPPDSLGKITSLHRLVLNDNKLSGEFPHDFANLTKLKYVYLQNNKFSGKFPSSVAKWTNLEQLNLSGNNFHGMLPNTSSIYLRKFIVTNNNLIGPIPKNLTMIPIAEFSGNIYLCLDKNFPFIFPRKLFTQKRILPYIPPCEDTVISQQSQSALDSPSLNHETEEKLCTAAIVVIAVGLALILLILLSYLRKERSKAEEEKKEPGVATKAAKAAARGFGKLD